MSYLGTKPQTATQLASGIVTTESIADGAVGTADIATSAVTPAKLSTGAPTWDTSGNVGIGTSSPSSYGQLAVYKSSGDVEAAVVTDGASYATYRVQNSSRRYSMQIRTDQSNAWTLRDETAGANRLLVDSSGRVTTPYQPAVHLVNPSNISGTGLITNWVARVNVGNHYSSGVFTCPVAGIYLVQGMVWRNTGTVDYAVRQNGVDKARIRNSAVNDAGYSGAIVLNCAANDTIDFFIKENSANNLYGATGYSETLTSALIRLLG